MKTRPKRLAVAAIVVLLIGAGAWWWQRHSSVKPAMSSGSPAMASPDAVATAMPRSGRLSPPGLTAADEPEQCSQAIRNAFNARARTLVDRDDANSQLAFALAVPFDAPVDLDRMDPAAFQQMVEQRSADGQRALLRAAKLAPAQPDILLVAATQCRAGDACRGVQQALLAADPDNLAVWLYEMGWAKMRNDPEAGERAFVNAAKAMRYDTYAESALKALVDAYGAMPMPVECSSSATKEALRQKTGMSHDFTMLDQALMLGTASRASIAGSDIRLRCMPRPGETLNAATRASCRNILGKMAEGDTLIDRAIGLRTMVQLAADGPDASAWRQRYRELSWLYAQLGDSDVQRLLQPEDYWMDEVPSMQAALQASGKWPPPANWLPDDEYSRSLILTGRPPPQKKPKPR